MALKKNTSGQKWTVFAFNRTNNQPKTGDAANITANLRIDGAAANAVDDTNPTELEDGFYIFDLTQAETNGDNIIICPTSSTANIQVIGVPGAVWTDVPAAGAGAITWPYALSDADTGALIDGAEVWVTTDSAGANVVASGTTNDSGVVTFRLDAGTYYIWAKRAGYNFSNPDTEVVS